MMFVTPVACTTEMSLVRLSSGEGVVREEDGGIEWVAEASVKALLSRLTRWPYWALGQISAGPFFPRQ